MKPVLVTVLNWGLGHATRSIPVIQRLIRHGARVHLASDGDALRLLTGHFPQLDASALPAYQIRYRYTSLPANAPAILWNLLRNRRREHQTTLQLARRLQAGVIISDSRFGTHTPFTKNIIISHQLRFPPGLPVLSAVASAGLRHLHAPFDHIWVPDFPGPVNLSGHLSHGHPSPKIRYIGPLSRFRRLPRSGHIKYDLLAILSGPEPQRTAFERRILNELESLRQPAAVVRGIPAAHGHPVNAPAGVTVFDFADASHLQTLMAQSHTIVSRSGYSSIMDYCALGLFESPRHRLLLVPTPGQPEQEYLARKLAREGRAAIIRQSRLNFRAMQFPTNPNRQRFPGTGQLLDRAIAELPI